MGGLNLPRVSRRLAAISVLLLGACQGGPVLDVTVTGLPDDTARLRLTARMLSQEAPWAPQPLSGRPERFDAHLPAGTSGRGTLLVSALSGDGCQSAAGIGSFDVGESGRYPLAVSLAAQPGCRVTLSRNSALGDAPGNIEVPGKRTCIGASCTFVAKLDEDLELVPLPALDQSFFSGWLSDTGDIGRLCRGSGPCSLRIAEGPIDLTYAFLPGQVCSSGFCWERPRPQGVRLLSVWAASPDEAWAVGALGAILRYDGVRWLPILSGTTENLGKVHGVRPPPGQPATSVWMVGDGGVVLRWDGARLHRVDIGTDQPLGMVWANSASNVWVCGNDGILVHGDGEHMVPVDAHTTDNLRALFSEGPGRATWTGGGHGRLRRIAGDEVTSYDLPTDQPVVWIGSWGAGDIWVLTDKGGQMTGQAWRLDGERFVLVPDAPGDLRALYSPSPDALYGVSNRTGVWRLGGTRWLAQDGDSTTLPWGISGTSADDIWTVGAGGLIRHFNGAFWQGTDTVDRDVLFSIHGPHPGALGIGGMRGTLLYNSGTRWLSRRIGQATIFGIWVAGVADNWVANGDLVHSTPGGDVVLSSRGPMLPVLGVFGLSPTDVWAVGSRGFILRSDGQAVVQEASGTTADLLSIWGSDADHLWAAGANGVVLRRENAAWRVVPTGTTERLLHITGSDAQNVWFIGEKATALHWDGVALRQIAVPGLTARDYLYSAWTSGPDDVWLGSDRLWHFDGRTWTRTDLGTDLITGLHGFGRPGPGQHIYLTTYSGGVMHRQGVAP